MSFFAFLTSLIRFFILFRFLAELRILSIIFPERRPEQARKRRISWRRKPCLLLWNSGMWSMKTSLSGVTGGGIISNLERAIPDNLNLKLNFEKIPKSDVFEKITKIIGHKEAYSTFNMNVGFALVVSKCNKDVVLDIASDYEPFVFGEVQ